MAKPKKSSRKPVTKKKAAPPKKAAKKAAPKKKTAPPKKKVAKKAAPKKIAKKAAPKKKPAPAKKAAAPKKKAAPKKVAARKKKVAVEVSAVERTMPAKEMARKAAQQVARLHEDEPRAFIEGSGSTDTLAEEMGEDAVRAMTTGEDEEGERDGEAEAEVGGPFKISSGSVEFAKDDEAPNIPSAEIAGVPTTRDEEEGQDDEDEIDEG